MKRGKIIFCKLFSVILVICLMLSGCVAEKSTEQVQDTSQTISVAFYSIFPDSDVFKEIILEEWEKIEPDVDLVIQEWDCYTGPVEADVFTYDAIFLTYLAENGHIQPIDLEEIECRDEVFPYVMDGITYNGKYYGAPYFLCANFLIYYKDDVEVAEADNICELYAITEDRRKEDKATGIPALFPVDDAYAYLDAYIDASGEYTTFERMPDCDNLNVELINPLRGVEKKFTEEELKGKGAPGLFAEGQGFAYIGVSEHLRDMKAILDKLDIKKITYADGKDIPLFYTDVASISSQVTDPEKLENCKKLMNLICSNSSLKKFLLEQEELKYVMPARDDVFSLAAEKSPLYSRLYEMASNEENKIYRAGTGIYDYLSEYEEKNVQ